jgi:hypothetical protein
LLLATALLATLMAACSPSGPTFDERGISFRYPAAWHRVPEIATSGGATSPLFSDNVGLDRLDAAIVALNHVNVPITTSNISQFAAQLRTGVERVARDQGGQVTQDATTITVDGLPGLQIAVAGIRTAGTPVDSTLTLVFKGSSEYFINCQHTSSHATEIANGCQQIIETLKIA